MLPITVCTFASWFVLQGRFVFTRSFKKARGLCLRPTLDSIAGTRKKGIKAQNYAETVAEHVIDACIVKSADQLSSVQQSLDYFFNNGTPGFNPTIRANRRSLSRSHHCGNWQN